MTDERRPTNRRFRIIMGALAIVAVVSGGAAYAASQDDSPQARSQAIVDDAAGTLGVDPGKLSDALKKALEKQVDAQVTAGKLTKERADAIKARIEDGTLPIFGRGPGGFGKHFGHRGHGPGFGPGFGGPGLAAGVEEIATYLGVTPEALRTDLRSGKSLADIAKAQGKTVDGLKTAITDAVTKRLDAAVTAGKLTKEQETMILAGLAEHLDDLVNGVHERHGGFGGGFGPGGMGDKGDCPNMGTAPDESAPPAAPADFDPAAPAAV
jgi:hypothetical protein